MFSVIAFMFVLPKLGRANRYLLRNLLPTSSVHRLSIARTYLTVIKLEAHRFATVPCSATRAAFRLSVIMVLSIYYEIPPYEPHDVPSFPVDGQHKSSLKILQRLPIKLFA